MLMESIVLVPGKGIFCVSVISAYFYLCVNVNFNARDVVIPRVKMIQVLK